MQSFSQILFRALRGLRLSQDKDQISAIIEICKQIVTEKEFLLIDGADHRNAYDAYDKLTVHLGSDRERSLVCLVRVHYYRQDFLDAVVDSINSLNFANLDLSDIMKVLGGKLPSQHKLVIMVPRILAKNVARLYYGVHLEDNKSPGLSFNTACNIRDEFLESGAGSFLSKRILKRLQSIGTRIPWDKPFWVPTNRGKRCKGRGLCALATIFAPSKIENYRRKGDGKFDGDGGVWFPLDGHINGLYCSHDQLEDCIRTLDDLGLIVQENKRPLFARYIYISTKTSSLTVK
jgi:hypothetical protein